MLDIYAEYAADTALENEGTWMEVGTAKFLVARAGNPKYVRKLSKAVTRNKRMLDRNDDAADQLSDKIMVDVMAETILLGWEGVAFQKKELPYSLENAKMLLGIKDFRRQISELADDFEAFKAEKEEEAKED